jgi:hypothetical protein
MQTSIDDLMGELFGESNIINTTSKKNLLKTDGDQSDNLDTGGAKKKNIVLTKVFEDINFMDGEIF